MVKLLFKQYWFAIISMISKMEEEESKKPLLELETLERNIKNIAKSNFKERYITIVKTLLKKKKKKMEICEIKDFFLYLSFYFIKLPSN